MFESIFQSFFTPPGPISYHTSPGMSQPSHPPSLPQPPTNVPSQSQYLCLHENILLLTRSLDGLNITNTFTHNKH